MLTTSRAMAYGIYKNQKGYFVPRLINPNGQQAALAFFDVAAEVLWLTAIDDEDGQLVSLDVGYPSPEFIMALKDFRVPSGLPISYTFVEELGINQGTESALAVEELGDGHKLEVRLLEESAFVGFDLLRFDDQDQRYIYRASLANGHIFELAVKSDRGLARMGKTEFGFNGVVIDGVTLPIFERHKDFLNSAGDGDYADRLFKRLDYYSKIYYVGRLHMNLDNIELARFQSLE